MSPKTPKATGAAKPIHYVTVGELRQWLGLDSDRRIQQLEKEGVVVTGGRGKYDLYASVQGYINELRKAKKTSGLTAKQEENLEIRNQRDRVEVLREYGSLVQKEAVAHELLPIIKALQTGLRALPNNTARENLSIAKEYAQALQDGMANDQEVTAAYRDRDLKIVDSLLQTMSEQIAERWGK